MSGTSSRMSSSTSAFGMRSNTYPERGSSSSESPLRSVEARSGSASRTTRSSSACEMTRARSPSSSSSLSMTISPADSYPSASTTLSASLSTTSWPGLRWSSSTAGLTWTRIFRPPVNTAAVLSWAAFRKTPKPDGGCASRSTSSLSATIWSRASRSVPVSRSFCAVTAARLASVSRSLSSRSRAWRGESASLRRNAAISSSRKEICAVRPLTSSSCREARELSSLLPTALTSFRCLNYLDPTYRGGIRNLRRRVKQSTHDNGLMPRGAPSEASRTADRYGLDTFRYGKRPSGGLLLGVRPLGRTSPPRRRGDPIRQPARGDEEPGVPDHPLLRPDRQPVHRPAAHQGLPRRWLVKPAVAAQRLHGPRQLRGGRHVAAEHPPGH